jgi:acetolactate synthase regulatory subunit
MRRELIDTVEALIISTMERLFSPCTRYRDIVESQGGLEVFEVPNPELLRELNLDVSTGELLSAERAFTYADLYAMIENGHTIAWLTPHAVVVRVAGRAAYAWELLNRSHCFCFNADDIRIFAFALSAEHLSGICDVVVRLLAVSEVHRVHIHRWLYPDLFINAPTLAYLMEQCQSLKLLTLKNQDIDEDLCRVLGSSSRPDLEIVLDNCTISDAGACALGEVLGCNQGPTKITICEIDNVILANGLCGNSRLKSWRPHISGSPDVGNREVLAIAGALRENKGLVDLDLSDGLRMNDVTWGAICDSLKAHPTLEVFTAATAAPALIKSQIEKLVDMMKVNMTMHTIRMKPRYIQYESFRQSVVPYLETNRFRPHLLAIQRTRPQAYRAKVLGRALLAVRTDPNRFWMLLSGNAEFAFPSTTASTTAAASLPTPANAAAPENVASVVASATAASSGVVSAAGQKRKECP